VVEEGKGEYADAFKCNPFECLSAQDFMADLATESAILLKARVDAMVEET